MSDYKIDTFSEDMLTLEEVTKHIEKIGKKRLSERAVRRWILDGITVGGQKLRLPSVKVGQGVFTSKQALNWFFNRSNDLKIARAEDRDPEPTPAYLDEEKQTDRVLKEMGIT